MVQSAFRIVCHFENQGLILVFNQLKTLQLHWEVLFIYLFSVFLSADLEIGHLEGFRVLIVSQGLLYLYFLSVVGAGMVCVFVWSFYSTVVAEEGRGSCLQSLRLMLLSQLRLW